MSAVVAKTVVVAGTIYRAGDKVPDEVAKKITAKGVLASQKVSKTDDSETTNGYAALKIDELKAEIEKRNEDRDEEAKLSAEGKKADLVAILTADDDN